jgi:Flp pilus assembly protein TadD
VRISPNDPNLHEELAAAYAADGRTDDAFCELIAAVLIDPLELKPAAFQIRYALATALIRAANASEGARQMELFERARRAADEQRRRDISDEVEHAERPRNR